MLSGMNAPHRVHAARVCLCLSVQRTDEGCAGLGGVAVRLGLEAWAT